MASLGQDIARADMRPVKTDVVAKRMIAAALDIKPLNKIEEQRAYDRAIREREIKKRNQEKEAAAKTKQETERARTAVWDD